MTTANKITILRILLVPFFVMQVLYYRDTGEERFRLFALLAFFIAAISDGVDGYIARRYHQRSELGAVLDPVADKLLLVSGIILLSLNNQPYLDRLPLWLAVTILSRDLLVVIGIWIIYFICGKVAMRPIWMSKCSTVLQMAVVLWTLLKWPSDWNRILCLVAGGCTAITGVQYVLEGIRQLSTSPSASASPGQDVSGPVSGDP